MEYKDTVNLLDTPFPMRAELAKREPQMYELWQTQNRYEKLRNICKGRDKFLLHDGPPYANGELHLGHAVNKVLKDIVIRSKTLSGFDAPFIPGWDCHGLPIELNVEKKFGKKLKAQEFRQKCRDYAETQVAMQKEQFKRLGILGQWDNPYLTMDKKYEADTVRALGEIYKNGYLTQGVKPVHWCIECGSALAEAEVEYQNKTSTAIYVKFKILDNDEFIKNVSCKDFEVDLNSNIYVVIWTTTPWTLPANMAVAVHSEIDYVLVKHNNDYLIVARDLAFDFGITHGLFTEEISELDIEGHLSIKPIGSGLVLENLMLKHPFCKRNVPIVLGEHVTTSSGTGLVHIAPAHGLEDYMVGLRYDLEIYNPVSVNGTFISQIDPESLALKKIWDCNLEIVEILKANGNLLSSSEYLHSYPHCWRHKTPLIFRTTSQWFISMDKVTISEESLRGIAGDSIFTTQFVPKWGQNRIDAMLKNRPDWCISRQRLWGVPIPFFIHKESGLPHPNTYEILQEVALLIEKNGIDVWFDDDLINEISFDTQDYIKSTDILDVWFDSGVSHYCLASLGLNLDFPADLYLEGSDQHRGWFQSSLLSSCAIYGKSPYKAIVTHGFTVDANGYKMSKSRGNGIGLLEAVNEYGADIVRLWIASTDYSNDLPFSKEIIKHVSESYRRIRNTIRFLLANLVDFEFEKDQISPHDLIEVDKYALTYLARLQDEVVNNLYPNYQFHLIVQELTTYASEFLGGFYLDILKDRLYTSKKDGKARRSAQTTLYYIAKSFLLMLSPILAFTTDEAWSIFNNDEKDSTLYHLYPNVPTIHNSENLFLKWEEIYKFRFKVLKELEDKRESKIIGSSLQAELTINATGPLFDILNSLETDLKFVYMVSKVQLNYVDHESECQIIVTPSAKNKCQRCWHYVDLVESKDQAIPICNRCYENVHGNGENRYFA